MEHKKTKLITYALLALLLVSGTGAGAWYYLQQKNEATTPTEAAEVSETLITGEGVQMKSLQFMQDVLGVLRETKSPNVFQDPSLFAQESIFMQNRDVHLSEFMLTFEKEELDTLSPSIRDTVLDLENKRATTIIDLITEKAHYMVACTLLFENDTWKIDGISEIVPAPSAETVESLDMMEDTIDMSTIEEDMIDTTEFMEE
jgi:hypothetical protein